MASIEKPAVQMPDLIDAALQAGATLDWISPTLAIIQNVVNGPSHTFLVSRECGQSSHDIARMLAEYGIHVWGQMVVCNTIMFTVRQPQARWAQYLLQRAGIPIENGEVGQAGLGLPPLPGRLTPANLLRWLGQWLKSLWRIADLSSLL